MGIDRLACPSRFHMMHSCGLCLFVIATLSSGLRVDSHGLLSGKMKHVLSGGSVKIWMPNWGRTTVMVMAIFLSKKTVPVKNYNNKKYIWSASHRFLFFIATYSVDDDGRQRQRGGGADT
jgi:hypothetical protein